MRSLFLMGLLLFATGALAGGPKREREEAVKHKTVLEIGTHLCRVDHGFKVEGKGAWKEQAGDQHLQTAYLPCEVIKEQFGQDKTLMLVRILPQGVYYAPYHKPILLSHENVVPVGKIRLLRKLAVGMHAFAVWETAEEAHAPKLWEVEILSFDIAARKARVKWLFTGEEHEAETTLDFDKIFHIQRE